MEFVSSASEECVGNTINLIILIWLSGSVSRGLPEGHAVGGGSLISYPLSPCMCRLATVSQPCCCVFMLGRCGAPVLGLGQLCFEHDSSQISVGMIEHNGRD